jgi:hypothetical protein
LLLGRADRDAPKGETRLCAWGLAAIDVRLAPSLATGPSGEFCKVSADGLKVSFKVLRRDRAQRFSKIQQSNRQIRNAAVRGSMALVHQ